MAERDAFGNELADATPEAAVVARPETSPPRSTRRVAGGCLAFVVVVTLVGGCMVGLTREAMTDGADAIRSLSTELAVSVPARTLPATAPPADAPARPPTGLGRGSLLRPAAFGDAVDGLRGAGLGRLRVLRLSPERIDAQLVTRTGRLRTVQVLPGGARRTLSTSGPGFSTGRTISLAAIDRRAPLRIVRSAAGRARTTPGAVDYLVLLDIAGVPTWVVHLRGGKGFVADRRGRNVKPIG